MYVDSFGRQEPSVEDAIEKAGAWLAENAPGLITLPEELYNNCDDTCNHDNGQCSSETDMTYTESGWIPSWEWGIVAENMTPKKISDLAHGRE